MLTIAQVYSKVNEKPDAQAVKLKRLMQRRTLARVLGGRCDAYCETCGGYGWIRIDGLPVSSDAFGKLFPCPNFQFDPEKIGLTQDEMTGLSWRDLQDWHNSRHGQALVVETLNRGAGWAYLWGGPGLAKTLILKIATAEALRAGFTGCYVRMTDILAMLRAAFDDEGDKDAAREKLAFWAGLDFLAIDEFDRVNETAWTKEQKFSLIDKRYEAACRCDSITLFASNADPARFEDYLVDRIFDNRFSVLEMKGVSARNIIDWTV